MRPNRLTSILAGIAAAVVLVVLVRAGAGASRSLRLLSAAGSLLFALGVALLPTVQPTLFGISLAGAFLIAAAAIVAASLSSNLAGLVVLSMAAVALGAAVFALMVASAAKALRRREVPGWFCYAAIAAGLVILLGANASQVRTKSKQAFQILDRVEEIRRAELAYAERHPGHAFTCNGPDLPGLAQLPWGAEEQLGRTERNRLQIDGRWIYLRCPPSAHPQAMSVIVIEPGKNALQFPVSRASPL